MTKTLLKRSLPGWACEIVKATDQGKRRSSGKRRPPHPSAFLLKLRNGLNALIKHEFFRLWAVTGSKEKAEIILSKYIGHSIERKIKNHRASFGTNERNNDLIESKLQFDIFKYLSKISRTFDSHAVDIKVNLPTHENYENDLIKSMLEAITCYTEVRSAAIESFDKPPQIRALAIMRIVEKCEKIRPDGVFWLMFKMSIEQEKRQNSA
ncbi:MAG: hypothetical protein ACT6Q8_03830 [Niveispirillum sp.]|uniref:hypothetical protein n=1 Tax=Niveispirillum sp. TaxID=1917217 RepID=UPI0040364389